MKRKRLKAFVVPVFTGILFSGLLITLISLNKTTETPVSNFDNFTYVNDSIIHDAVPTLSEDDVIIRPYDSEKITIFKKFYDGEENKEDSIIYYNGTYMQNSGIIYNSDTEFKVVSILEGEIKKKKKDDILGYVVEVKHDNNFISSYEGLKNVVVKKGDKITQNAMIGKSGEISLDVNLKNALLFELIKDGKYVNPEKYYDKKVKEI